MRLTDTTEHEARLMKNDIGERHELMGEEDQGESAVSGGTCSSPREAEDTQVGNLGRKSQYWRFIYSFR